MLRGFLWFNLIVFGAMTSFIRGLELLFTSTVHSKISIGLQSDIGNAFIELCMGALFLYSAPSLSKRSPTRKDFFAIGLVGLYSLAMIVSYFTKSDFQTAVGYFYVVAICGFAIRELTRKRAEPIEE